VLTKKGERRKGGGRRRAISCSKKEGRENAGPESADTPLLSFLLLSSNRAGQDREKKEKGGRERNLPYSSLSPRRYLREKERRKKKKKRTGSELFSISLNLTRLIAEGRKKEKDKGGGTGGFFYVIFPQLRYSSG